MNLPSHDESSPIDRPSTPKTGTSGFTLPELLVMIVILVAVVATLLPMLARARPHQRTIGCINNLKNVGLALRIFATDNNDLFPMDLSVTNGGTREWLADETQLWRHWRALSNELSTPRILLCDRDLQRRSVADPEPLTWDRTTNNAHLSYFLGLNGRGDNPHTILAGDRNLTTNKVAIAPGRLVLTKQTVLGWTGAIHDGAGNILLGDNSVQQVAGSRLQEALQDALDDVITSSRFSTNAWLVP